MYKGYPTTAEVSLLCCKVVLILLQEDEERLKDPGLSVRQRLATKLRLGERNILMRIGSYYHEKSKQYAEELKELDQHIHEEL